MSNLLDKPYLVLVFSLMVALSGWGVGHQSWADLITVKAFFELLGIVGGVALASFGKSPLPGNHK